jgi:hypothetical protein
VESVPVGGGVSGVVSSWGWVTVSWGGVFSSKGIVAVQPQSNRLIHNTIAIIYFIKLLLRLVYDAGEQGQTVPAFCYK